MKKTIASSNLKSDLLISHYYTKLGPKSVLNQQVNISNLQRKHSGLSSKKKEAKLNNFISKNFAKLRASNLSSRQKKGHITGRGSPISSVKQGVLASNRLSTSKFKSKKSSSPQGALAKDRAKLSPKVLLAESNIYKILKNSQIGKQRIGDIKRIAALVGGEQAVVSARSKKIVR